MSEPLTAAAQRVVDSFNPHDDTVDIYAIVELRGALATLDAARPSGYPPPDPGAQHDDASDWFAARPLTPLEQAVRDGADIYGSRPARPSGDATYIEPVSYQSGYEDGLAVGAARPSGEVDVHVAYREGRRAVWTELIELAEQGIQASSEPALDG